MTTMRDDPAVVALVERARAGEHDAWDQIVRRYSPLVWSVCRHMRVSGSEADDVAASVWLRLIERLSSLREPAALPGWIATTTRRECLQVFRARARTVPVEPFEQDRIPAEDDAEFDDWLLTEQRRLALRDAFAELSERCRRLLSLLFHDPPMPYAEISETMGMKVPSIGPTRMRCLQKLRESPSVLALMDTAPAGGR